MFENLSGWEIIVLALLGLFIFGPERLPKVIGDAMRTLRNLRDMARNATNDLSREMGTEVKLEDLHPKTFIRKHLLSEEDERELRRPFDDMYRDVREISNDAAEIGRSAAPNPRSYERSDYSTSTYDGSGYGSSGYGSSGYDSAGYGTVNGPDGGSLADRGADGAQPDRGSSGTGGTDQTPGSHRYDADAT